MSWSVNVGGVTKEGVSHEEVAAISLAYQDALAELYECRENAKLQQKRRELESSKECKRLRQLEEEHEKHLKEEFERERMARVADENRRNKGKKRC